MRYDWNLDAALGYYREVIRTRILSDRVLSMNERYAITTHVSSKNYGVIAPKEFAFLRGPECISRPRPFAHRVDPMITEPELESGLEDMLDSLEVA